MKILRFSESLKSDLSGITKEDKDSIIDIFYEIVENGMAEDLIVSDLRESKNDLSSFTHKMIRACGISFQRKSRMDKKYEKLCKIVIRNIVILDFVNASKKRFSESMLETYISRSTKYLNISLVVKVGPRLIMIKNLEMIKDESKRLFMENQISESLKEFREITDEELRKVEDIFSDMIDDGLSYKIDVEVFDESKHSSHNLIDLIKKFNDVSELGITHFKNEKFKFFVRKLKENAICVSIRTHSLPEINSNIVYKNACKVEKYVGLEYVMWHSKMSGNVKCQCIYFIKNKFALKEIWNEIDFTE